MTAPELIAAITDSGVHLEPAGPNIRWIGVLNAGLHAELVRQKVPVLALLRAQAGICSECAVTLGGNGGAVTLALVADDGTTACAACVSGLTSLRRKGVAI